jgi:hypothetical protein
MGFRETGWEGVGSIYLAQDTDKNQALVEKVLNLRVEALIEFRRK